MIEQIRYSIFNKTIFAPTYIFELQIHEEEFDSVLET